MCRLGVSGNLDMPLGSAGYVLSKATLLRLPESVNQPNKQTNKQTHHSKRPTLDRHAIRPFHIPFPVPAQGSGRPLQWLSAHTAIRVVGPTHRAVVCLGQFPFIKTAIRQPVARNSSGRRPLYHGCGSRRCADRSGLLRITQAHSRRHDGQSCHGRQVCIRPSCRFADIF